MTGQHENKERMHRKGSENAPQGPGFGRPGGGPMGMFMGKKERARDTRGTLLRIWRYLRRDVRRLLVVLLLVLVSTAMHIAGPVLLGRAVDAMAIPLLGGVGLPGVDFDLLWMQVLLLGGSYLFGAVATWGQIYLMSGIAQQSLRMLRRDMFSQIQKLPLKYFDSKPHGELMSRMTNDVETLSNVLTQNATQLVSSGVLLVGMFGVMLFFSPTLTLFTILAVPIGFVLTNRISKFTRRYFSEQQKELGSLNGYVEESLSGIRVIKAFGIEKESHEHFSQVNQRLNQAGIRAQIYAGIIPPLMNAVNNISFAIVAVAGGALVLRGVITVGLVATFTNFSRQFSRPITELANLYNQIQSAIAGAERVFEVLDEKPEFGEKQIDNRQEGILTSEVRGEVVFKDVSFAYEPGVPVLKNINLHAKPGQSIALVGPTGSGKTTVVNLLTRFYDIDEGSILVDGQDIRSLQKNGLRSAMGIVLQDSRLFTDTVRENIRYGRLDATDEEVEAAARIAEADSFIRRLPESYDTVLPGDGSSISQGQRQLLTIARAILADPPILILDEATSNVDTLTEMHIQRAMRKLMAGRTSFVIAHRLSTIRDADEILYLRDGEIRERGRHEELVAQKGFYSILHSQLSHHEA